MAEENSPSHSSTGDFEKDSDIKVQPTRKDPAPGKLAARKKVPRRRYDDDTSPTVSSGTSERLMAIKILDVESIDAIRAKTMLKIQAIRILHNKIFQEEKRRNRLIGFLTIFCVVIGFGLVVAIFFDQPISYESVMNVTSNAEKYYEVEDTHIKSGDDLHNKATTEIELDRVISLKRRRRHFDDIRIYSNRKTDDSESRNLGSKIDKEMNKTYETVVGRKK